MEYYPDLGPVIIAQWRAQPQANLQAWLYDANAMVFNTAAWVTYAGLSHTVTLTESSMLWLHAVIAWSASAVRINAIGWRITVDTTQINPGVIEQEPQINGQQVTTLSMMAGPYAAGSHTIDVQGYRVNAGDTVTAQYSGSGYLAIPNG